MNPLFHLQEQPPLTEAVTDLRRCTSLLLREDVRALLNFQSYMTQQARNSHVNGSPAIKGLRELRSSVADTLSETYRQQKTVEVAIKWTCVRHRQLAKEVAQSYIEFFDRLEACPRASKWLSVDTYRATYQPIFERIVSTIDETRN